MRSGGVLQRLEWLEAEVQRLKGRTTIGGGGVPTSTLVTELDGFSGDPGEVLLGDGTFGIPPGSGITQLTGDVTAGPGSGTQAATIAADAVTNAKLANMAQATLKGRAAGAGSGDPTDLSAAQAIEILGLLAQMEVVIDGGGASITTGIKGYVRVPFGFTVTGVVVFADQSGDIEIDLQKDVYANFPPDSADSIVASAPPTLSGAQASKDTTLTGWDTAWDEDDVIAVEVISVTDVTRVSVFVFGIRTA